VKKKEITLITDTSKSRGGANIAAIRISKVLKNKFKINLLSPESDDIINFLKIKLARIMVKLFIGKTKYLNSLNLFSRVKKLKDEKNILHVHWIGNEAISLDYLIKTKRPILWTMHDMWAITSTEHFLDNPKLKKYTLKNCNKNFIKKSIFYKKKKLFKKKNIHLIANSKWLEKFAKKSELTKNLKINTIYNPIETDQWIRKNKVDCKNKLNLSLKKDYILFGAHGGLKNPRKGGDLLLEIIKKIDLINTKNELEIIILGTDKTYIRTINGIKFNFRKLEKNIGRQLMYHSAVNLTVATSKAESLPQFTVETILCNNPVVSFDIGGNNEIIKHKFNGYLARTYDTADFARGINFCLNNINQKKLLSTNKKIRKMFDPKLVLKRYSNILKAIN